MKAYFKFILALYIAVFAAGGACRVILKLWHMDTSTGFYSGGGMYVLIFNICLFAAPVIMFATNRLKRPDDDYPVETGGSLTGLFAILTGLAMLAFALTGAPELILEQNHGALFLEIRRNSVLITGVLSGLSFLYLGVFGLLKRRNPPSGFILIIPAVWQIIYLLTRYNSYTTVTAISDHLLLVLFMVFNSLFLMGQARTICSQMRKDGRNYAIPAGLCASLCGLFLVIPNYVYLAVNRTIIMPVAMLGLMESVYVLIMSLYALCFAAGLMWSIKRA